jgi:hypothetical protein
LVAEMSVNWTTEVFSVIIDIWQGESWTCRLLWKQTKCKGHKWHHRVQVLLLLTNINKDLIGLVIGFFFLQIGGQRVQQIFSFPVEPNVDVSPYCSLNIDTCVCHCALCNVRRAQLQF